MPDIQKDKRLWHEWAKYTYPFLGACVKCGNGTDRLVRHCKEHDYDKREGSCLILCPKCHGEENQVALALWRRGQRSTYHIVIDKELGEQLAMKAYKAHIPYQVYCRSVVDKGLVELNRKHKKGE